MVTTLNAILRGLMKRNEDTGWVDLPLSSAHMIWDLTLSGGHARARRTGNLVELSIVNLRSQGIVQRKESRITSGLPERMRPSKAVFAPAIAVPSSGMMMGGILKVHADGLVTIEPLATHETYVPAYGIYAQVTYIV